MELDAEAAPDDVRLGTDVGLGEHRRARRRLERVEVPLEPGPSGTSSGSLRAHRQPADLRRVGAVAATAERAGQQLAAEADAEHRDVARVRAREQLDLARDPRDVVGVGGRSEPSGISSS